MERHWQRKLSGTDIESNRGSSPRIILRVVETICCYCCFHDLFNDNHGTQAGFVYSTGHLARNGKAGPGWISYLGVVSFYTKFSITTPEFLFSCNSQPAFLIARFLLTVGVLYNTAPYTHYNTAQYNWGTCHACRRLRVYMFCDLSRLFFFLPAERRYREISVTTLILYENNHNIAFTHAFMVTSRSPSD